MEIKTITYALHCAEDFDYHVNQAVAEGWLLTKREPLAYGSNGRNLVALYAELVKVPPTAEQPPAISPLEALRMIRQTCEAQTSETCDNGSCPLHEWCTDRGNSIVGSPAEWYIPEEVET